MPYYKNYQIFVRLCKLIVFHIKRCQSKFMKCDNFINLKGKRGSLAYRSNVLELLSNSLARKTVLFESTRLNGKPQCKPVSPANFRQ